MKLIFEQTNKRNAVSKMKRLGTNSNHIRIGFCDFTLERNLPENVNPYEVDKNDYWVICAYSTYHSENTINNMFKTNGKKW
jgi:hypothetical protein